MAPRPYSPLNWSTGRRGSRHTKSSKTSELVKTRWTKWTRLEMRRSSTLHATSSPYEGDLVLRLRQDNRGRHKLSPLWEGPNIIAKVLKPGSWQMKTAKSSPTLGTYNSYIASIL